MRLSNALFSEISLFASTRNIVLATVLAFISMTSTQTFAKSEDELLKEQGEKGGINPFTQAMEEEKAALRAKTPLLIAVLPATGVETDASRNDIRSTLHNVLSSTEFDLLKPTYIDKQLETLTNGKQLRDFTKSEICRHLGVSGLLLVELTKQDKVYAGAYASFTVGIKAELYSLKTDSIIWTFNEEEAEREGGVSANPLSIVTTAITSTSVLKDSIRYRLIDVLARKFAIEIPKPINTDDSLGASKIELAHSNAIDSPFTLDKEFKVQMVGEEGMKAIVKIGSSDITFPLTESEKGIYNGVYKIKANDKVTNGTINVHAIKPSKKWTQLKVPGSLSINTNLTP